MRCANELVFWRTLRRRFSFGQKRSNVLATKSEHNQVTRSLKTRHLSMIALGGSIGTGLFVASGGAIAGAGPGGAILAYLGIGVMVFFLMTSLGEMATYIPVSGSFSEYASRFVDPAVGFALGWNYWFNWAITVAVDIATTAIVMHFWLPHGAWVDHQSGFSRVDFYHQHYFSQKFWRNGILVVVDQSDHGHCFPDCRRVDDFWDFRWPAYRLFQLHL
jgi:amino acid permease